MRRTPNNKRGNKKNVLNYETKLRRHSRDELSKSDKIRNKKHDDNRTLEMIKEIRTSISIKKNRTLVKKRKSKLCYNSKRIRTKVITLNTYKTRETTIYKELSRRFTS